MKSSWALFGLFVAGALAADAWATGCTATVTSTGLPLSWEAGADVGSPGTVPEAGTPHDGFQSAAALT
jgi:hypothetical protein